jgi:Zn-dependent peptidase ImmA (M78 family)
MDKRKIEDTARRLRRQVYDRREEYWPDREPHPLEMLEPAIAAHVLGVEFHYMPDLMISVPGVRFETAGILDRRSKTIAVATRFGTEVTRFTAAHEIGHWLLHPTDRMQHRDMPIKGIEREERDPREREADYFAAVYLMPDRFVRKVFRAMFLTDEPFVFDEATAYHLRPYDVDALLYPDRDSIDREIALASAKSFNGRPFAKSLAEMFHVSVGTMAIRIRELGLV